MTIYINKSINEKKYQKVKMDFGEAKFILSQRLNKNLLVYNCDRNVGFVYKFHKKNETQYACVTCKSLGKNRVITVRDGRIVGLKHPEDDHHVSCRPVSEDSVEILDMDRTMRQDVHRTGKRPRDAYSETIATIPKRFKTSERQKEVFFKADNLKYCQYYYNYWSFVNLIDFNTFCFLKKFFVNGHIGCENVLDKSDYSDLLSLCNKYGLLFSDSSNCIKSKIWNHFRLHLGL